MKKTTVLEVKGTAIAVLSDRYGDFISLTDMLKAKDGDFFISDWLRNRNTVEFLGIWERVHNPNFNCGEFAAIRSQAGLNSYRLSVREWVAQTNAIGLRAGAAAVTAVRTAVRLNQIAISQMRSLLASSSMKKLK